jgi:hypothetical protein
MSGVGATVDGFHRTETKQNTKSHKKIRKWSKNKKKSETRQKKTKNNEKRKNPQKPITQPPPFCAEVGLSHFCWALLLCPTGLSFGIFPLRTDNFRQKSTSTERDNFSLFEEKMELAEHAEEHSVLRLPVEVVLEVFRWLGPESLLRAEAACRQWRAITGPGSPHGTALWRTVPHPPSWSCRACRVVACAVRVVVCRM